MTDYEVTYSFQNIRFTDPSDFGGKDTLFTIDDLDLSEDEKYVLIDFMADHRLPGKTDDYSYDDEYWGDNAIFCTVTAYGEDELKSMTEGTLVTSMGPTFQDLFILWDEFPDWLKSKVKDYWGRSADMLYERACSVEDVSDDDDDDFDYALDVDEDLEDIADWGDVDKTASNQQMSTYVGKPLTDEILENIADEAENKALERIGLEYSDDTFYDGSLRLRARIGTIFYFCKDGEEVDTKSRVIDLDYDALPDIPDSCKDKIITDCQFDPDYDEWDSNIEAIEDEYDNFMGEEGIRHFTFTVNIYVS